MTTTNFAPKKTVLLQFKYEVFRPFGKYYTEDFVCAEVELIESDGIYPPHPCQVNYTAYDVIRKAIGDRYKGMIIVVRHELMVPFVINGTTAEDLQ